MVVISTIEEINVQGHTAMIRKSFKKVLEQRRAKISDLLGAEKIGNFDPALLEEFFKAFSDHSGITLHINLLYGRNNHHMAEAIFKALARALRKAVTIDSNVKGVLSTKGVL